MEPRKSLKIIIPLKELQGKIVRLTEIKIIVSDEVFELFPVKQKHVQKFAAHVLKSSGISQCDVNIVLVNDEKMTELNEKFKKRKSTTDVLSFNLSDESSDIVEGEVYISLERAKKQSLDYNVPYEEEIIRLVTHGLLHLAGRTHNSDEEYQSMMEDTEKFVNNFFHNGELN